MPVGSARYSTFPAWHAWPLFRQAPPAYTANWRPTDSSIGDNLRRSTSPLRGTDHALWPHPFVELLLANVAQRKRGGLERGPFAMCVLGDRGSLIVTDMRVQRRHKHQRAFEELA